MSDGKSKGSGRAVRLDLSRNPRAFLPEDSFWCREVERICSRVARQQESLGGAKSASGGGGSRMEADEGRPFLSIAIFGPSGSGKSSLLRTLAASLNDPKPVHWPDCEGLNDSTKPDGARGGESRLDRSKIYSLPVIQPDRFADHDHFLYSFLASSLKEEKERRERRERWNEDRPSSLPNALSPVQQAFQELGEFLRVIDEPERSREFDPLGLSLERLERHTSGLLLRDKLGQFIDSLADELTGSHGDSLIVLPVDDADMAPKHLIKTLHAYQTYLLHPRLVPVFTFTDRTAEEILRVHFQGYVSPKGGQPEARLFQDPGEGTQKLRVSEQLALQFLARCFPVRNRVRLGPAPARMRERPFLASHQQEEQRTRDLLRRGSQTLFGCRDRESENEIHAALRPATLRRQLHVVDELSEAGVLQLWVDDDERPRWVEVFDRASWSLMNVHRDVLREFDLHLEDLYSWTPRGLQRMILDTILGLKLETRRSVLRRWRRRTESRRGQVLSLLAANVFRPWLPGEEPAGDQGFVPPLDRRALTSYREGDDRIAASTAMIWFLRLVLGFYLPQALAWYRPNDIAATNPEKGRISGVGWDVASGPVNAIRAAEANEAMASSGMLFLDPKHLAWGMEGKFWRHLPTGTTEETMISAEDLGDVTTCRTEALLRCWCFHGFGRGRYWAAVSFWRGMGLIGQLLEARRRFQLEQVEVSGKNSDAARAWRRLVEGVIRSHIVHGLVPDEFMGEDVGHKGRWKVAFKRWDLSNEQLKIREDREGQVATFAEELFEWLNRLGGSSGENEMPIRLSEELEGRLGPEPNQVPLIPRSSGGVGDLSCRWSRSLLRRLHGEDVVGNLFAQINSAYIEDQQLFPPERDGEEPSYRWNVGVALTSWTRLLLDYWRGLFAMQELLRTCPLLAPFADGPITTPLRNLWIGKQWEEFKKDQERVEDRRKPGNGADWTDIDQGPLDEVDRQLRGWVNQRRDWLLGSGGTTGYDLDRFLKRLGASMGPTSSGSAPIDPALVDRTCAIVDRQTNALIDWGGTVWCMAHLWRVRGRDFSPSGQRPSGPLPSAPRAHARRRIRPRRL